MSLASKLFQGLNVKFSSQKNGLSFEIASHTSTAPSEILALLTRLNTLGKKSGKILVLFFDEFQRLAEILNNYTRKGATPISPIGNAFGISFFWQ